MNGVIDVLRPLNWLIPSIFVIILVLVIAYFGFLQNISTTTTSEIEVLSDTVSAGVIRSEIDENGEVDNKHLDKDEVVAHLLSQVVKVQKNHPYDIKVDYVFLDENKKVTHDSDKIRSVQFRIQYLDKKGKVVATSEKHLALNSLD